MHRSLIHNYGLDEGTTTLQVLRLPSLHLNHIYFVKDQLLLCKCDAKSAYFYGGLKLFQGKQLQICSQLY